MISTVGGIAVYSNRETDSQNQNVVALGEEKSIEDVQTPLAATPETEETGETEISDAVVPLAPAADETDPAPAAPATPTTRIPPTKAIACRIRSAPAGHNPSCCLTGVILCLTLI